MYISNNANVGFANQLDSDAQNYNYGLDILRIFSMVAVLLVHLRQTKFFPQALARYTAWGQYGVQIFFVLSGYLAVKTYKKKEPIRTYYKKRAFRILPTYYLAITFAVITNISMKISLPEDPFHLGWFRYYLGMNMILPSKDYLVWNNAYGWWTMGTFIGFYILVPLIMKLIDSFKKAIISIPILVLISGVWKRIYLFLFNAVNYDNIDVTIAGGTIQILVQFAVGICTYFALKESKIGECLLMDGIILVGAFILGKNNFLWCAIAGIFILSAQFICGGGGKIKIRKFVKFWSRQSYYIYLVHLIVIQVLDQLQWFEERMIGARLYYLAFILLVLIMSFVLKAFDDLINKMRV